MDGSAIIFLRVILGSAWALGHMDIWQYIFFDSVLSYLGFLSSLLLASAWRICSHLVLCLIRDLVWC